MSEMREWTSAVFAGIRKLRNPKPAPKQEITEYWNSNLMTWNGHYIEIDASQLVKITLVLLISTRDICRFIYSYVTLLLLTQQQT